MIWSIAELIQRQVSRGSKRPMLFYGEQTLGYGDIDAQADRVAAGLHAAGLSAGDRVALLDKNSPEQFEILFGNSKAGVVTVPINWRLSPDEVIYILNHSEARIVFVGAEFAEPLMQRRAKLEREVRIIVMDEDAGDAYSLWLTAAPTTAPRIETKPDDVSLQLYTSGTTGRPKGVMLTSRNLFTLLNASDDLWGLDSHSISIVCMPLFHIGGIGWALACLLHGGAVCLTREFEPKSMLATIEAHKATHANFVPAMLAALTDAAQHVEYDYSSLALILYGTAPISKPLLMASMRTFGCCFNQVYGLTETTSAITQLDWDDHKAGLDRLQSAGRAYPWIELKIVDPNSERQCRSGETGELWVKSAQNMKGYWRDPEATLRSQKPGGWLATGDAGYLDEDGYLFLTDRVKDMIVSGGENIYPAEVERVLVEHDMVNEVAVIGIPHDRWGEEVKAMVVPASDVRLDEAELIDWCREHLARYKCPKSVDFIDALPRNATGKVLKRILREPYWCEKDRAIN